MIDNKVEGIRKHLEAIAEILGIEKTESNENTPLRVAKMWNNEVFRNRNNANIEELNSQMKVFDAVGNRDRVTITVPFSSMCEHHWMPFMGTVSVSYIPKDKIIGLSKIPRVVKYFSKKPQLQERLTSEIGDYLVSVLNPDCLSVDITATHTCVSVRGIESPCETVTEYQWTDFEGMMNL
jgi:GTP cyclohydrolase I